MLKRIARVGKWLAVSLLVVVLLLLLPVGYIETFCRADSEQDHHSTKIADPDFLRQEANSYLTYPEWHIVYAYEGLAKVLQTGDEHQFGYISSIAGFWSSFCALNKVANRHGGGDFDTRGTVHTIGVSFTFEMLMKAFYEETIGRVFAAFRGADKAPQDAFAAEMAADYAQFLHQVPWYKYDFENAVQKLWEQPVTAFARGWERRLALGGEWKAKAAYAGVIAKAVEAAGQAPLRIRSVVNGMTRLELLSIAEVDVVEQGDNHVMIETPRYRKFTGILSQIIDRGGRIVEIAGNDEILLSAIGPDVGDDLQAGELVSRIGRDGHEGQRYLFNVRLDELANMLRVLQQKGLTLEHIYDY